MSFFSFNQSDQSELFIDVNRKLVINSRNMTTSQELLYRRSFFMSARPDLTDWEKRNWRRKLYLGEQYLGQLRKNLQNEVGRICFQYPLATRMSKISVMTIPQQIPIQELNEQFYQLSVPFVQGGRPSANRNWIDQNQKLARLTKYGKFDHI